MHGTGLRLASHTVGRGGEELFEGGCEKAVLLAKAEKESFQPAEHALGPIRTLFGPSVLGRVRYFTSCTFVHAQHHSQHLPLPFLPLLFLLLLTLYSLTFSLPFLPSSYFALVLPSPSLNPHPSRPWHHLLFSFSTTLYLPHLSSSSSLILILSISSLFLSPVHVSYSPLLSRPTLQLSPPPSTIFQSLPSFFLLSFFSTTMSLYSSILLFLFFFPSFFFRRSKYHQ